MPHSTTLLTTIAASLAAALAMGLLASRLKLPPLVGYLVAGMLIGPATPGFHADLELSGQLAEIGVILLMFGVGMHFSLQDLWSVRKIAVPGAALQIAAATAMGFGLAAAWGWPFGAALVFGLALSVASTVVLIQALERRGLLQSVNGRIAVGWLVVEDLAMVLALILLPALSGPLGGASAGAPGASALAMSVFLTLGKVSLFIALMLVLGRRLFPKLLWQVGRTGSRELFTLCVIAVAVGVAYGSARLFGVSFALGAFFAGMVMRESALSHRAAEESLPLRDAFSVLFFVSVGMLFDPRILMSAPLKVLAVVAIIVIGKSLAALVLVLAFRYPLNTALTVSASLAQIGEFSFILAGFGVAEGILPKEGQSLILAGALISISLNHLVFQLVEPARGWIRSRSRFARALERTTDPLAQLPVTVRAETLTGHVVLVGYGRVGRRIGEALAERGLGFVAVDENRELVEALRSRGHHAVAGDASVPAVLIQAHIARARLLVIAAPDAPGARRMVATAKMLNPQVQVLLRTHSEEEAELLRQENAGTVFMGEHELAVSMIRKVAELTA
ncbi:MAG: YbaL family putative K(+) efflux transporter [Elusimicrobia bacterium]|nr:YbaL family putative K(+) efflux transporter [Elusimicrobiota bacterium]